MTSAKKNIFIMIKSTILPISYSSQILYLKDVQVFFEVKFTENFGAFKEGVFYPVILLDRNEGLLTFFGGSPKDYIVEKCKLIPEN